MKFAQWVTKGGVDNEWDQVPRGEPPCRERQGFQDIYDAYKAQMKQGVDLNSMFKTQTDDKSAKPLRFTAGVPVRIHGARQFSTIWVFCIRLERSLPTFPPSKLLSCIATLPQCISPTLSSWNEEGY